LIYCKLLPPKYPSIKRKPKMKPTKSILILLSLFLISNCGENLIEEVKERYDNGEVKVVEYYKKVGQNQKLDKRGKSGKRVYYYENGQIKEERNFKDGKNDGKFTYYYENGQIKEERHYKDGRWVRKDGKFISYYENGQIWEERNFKDGKLGGKYTYYHKNGQIKGEGNFKDDKRDGKWTYYNKDGSIDKVEEYKDGEFVK
jgi:antitoxin component YwqK of YwqJK toxin-antitoxin module